MRPPCKALQSSRVRRLCCPSRLGAHRLILTTPQNQEVHHTSATMEIHGVLWSEKWLDVTWCCTLVWCVRWKAGLGEIPAACYFTGISCVEVGIWKSKSVTPTPWDARQCNGQKTFRNWPRPLAIYISSPGWCKPDGKVNIPVASRWWFAKRQTDSENIWQIL